MTQYNRSASIPCGIEAGGSPLPAFRWTRGGTEDAGRGLMQLLLPDRFSVAHESGELMLSVAWHADSGVYQCTATNSIGSATIFINVLVLGMYY